MSHHLRVPAEHAAYMRSWYASNRDRKSAHDAANKANDRAARMGRDGRITGADILGLWSRQPVCVACGEGKGIDHVRALADGGLNVVDNLQTMCKPCNRSKEHVALRARLGR